VYLEPLAVGQRRPHPGCEEDGCHSHDGPGNDHQDSVSTNKPLPARVSSDVSRVCGWADLAARQDGVVSDAQVVGGEVGGTGGGAHAVHGEERVVEVKVLNVGSCSVTADC